MSSFFPLLAVPKLETTSPSFRQALVRQALDAGLDPNLVAATISFESGFNPQAINQYSGATGLIQWMPGNFPVPHLAQLSAEEQLPYAIRWFVDKGARGATRATDYYLSVFLPAFIGASPSLTVGRKGSSEPLRLSNGQALRLTLGKMYEQNPVFDTAKKGYFTIGDIGTKIEALVTAARGRAAVPVPLPVMEPPRPSAPTGAPNGLTGSSSPSHSRPRLPPRIGSPRTVFREKVATDLPRLVRGSHGPAVLLLQRLLWATKPEGDDRLIDFDAEFGAQTELWVALHQHDAGLEPDGVVGPATWSAFCDDEMWGPDRTGLATLDGYEVTSDDDHELSVAPTVAAPAITVPIDLARPAHLPKPPKAPL